MSNKRLLRCSFDKKFQKIRELLNAETPPQGWIKTIRECFGMTTTQLAKKLKVSQPRIINIEQNEKNLKISTLEKIADAINCKFFYILIPKESIDKLLYNQAKQKALKILNRVNKNMSLENQLVDSSEILEDLIKELLADNIARVWDEDEK